MSDKTEAKVSRKRAIIFITHPLVTVMGSAIGFYLVAILIEIAWPVLAALWHVWWLTAIGTIAVLLVGVGLFFFRKHYRMYYGLSEVGFALTVSWISLARAQTVQDAASWIAVVAAAYLIVRGLDNYEAGRTEAAERNKFWISDSDTTVSKSSIDSGNIRA